MRKILSIFILLLSSISLNVFADEMNLESGSIIMDMGNGTSMDLDSGDLYMDLDN